MSNGVLNEEVGLGKSLIGICISTQYFCNNDYINNDFKASLEIPFKKDDHFQMTTFETKLSILLDGFAINKTLYD